jgi:hypothetical protein
MTTLQQYSRQLNVYGADIANKGSIKVNPSDQLEISFGKGNTLGDVLVKGLLYQATVSSTPQNLADTITALQESNTAETANRLAADGVLTTAISTVTDSIASEAKRADDEEKRIVGLISELAVGGGGSLSSTGGVWLATSSGPLIAGTTLERSLFTDVTALGSLSFPSNTLTVSAYHFNVAGKFASQGNNLTIRLKSDTLVLSELPLILTGSLLSNFELEGDLVIRAVGAAGVAVLSSNWDFTYSDGDTTTFRGDRVCALNTSTFNTTIATNLNITIQFSMSTTANSIQMLQGILTKVY